MITTTRLGLEVPQSTDNESLYPAVAAQAMGILDNAAIYTEGTLASRPAATAVVHGAIYRATDTGDLSYSNGTVWTTLGLVGVWQGLTLGSGVTGSGYTPSARLQGDTTRLKGGLLNSSGSTITAGATLATIPSGLRPTATLSFAEAFGGFVILSTAGLITMSANVGAAQVVALDGITFSLS